MMHFVYLDLCIPLTATLPSEKCVPLTSGFCIAIRNCCIILIMYLFCSLNIPIKADYDSVFRISAKFVLFLIMYFIVTVLRNLPNSAERNLSIICNYLILLLLISAIL